MLNSLGKNGSNVNHNNSSLKIKEGSRIPAEASLRKTGLD
jgi:hypothetical protein